MPFQPGHSGNPQGRPPGITDKRSKYRELFNARAPELINKAIDMALSGNALALKLCIERIAPKATDNHLEINLPAEQLDNPTYLLESGINLLQEIFSGKVSTEQGKRISSILENQRKLTETVELKVILEQLKEKITN